MNRGVEIDSEVADDIDRSLIRGGRDGRRRRMACPTLTRAADRPHALNHADARPAGAPLLTRGCSIPPRARDERGGIWSRTS